jgi:hypothetical protein
LRGHQEVTKGRLKGYWQDVKEARDFDFLKHRKGTERSKKALTGFAFFFLNFFDNDFFAFLVPSQCLFEAFLVHFELLSAFSMRFASLMTPQCVFNLGFLNAFLMPPQRKFTPYG